MPLETCPNCGAEVPSEAKACPGCGADDQTGWSEQAGNDGLDLPDDCFDYDKFVKEEFGPGRNKPHGIRWFWWVIAILLVAGLLLLWLRY